MPIVKFLQLPELPCNPEIAQEVIRGTTDNQKRKYLSPDKEDRFLQSEKGNSAQKLVNKQLNVQSTGKENKFEGFSKEVLQSKDLDSSKMEYKSNMFINTTLAAPIFNCIKNSFQNSSATYSQKLSNLFLKINTFENSIDPFTIKQYAKSLISTITSPILDSDQDKLVHQLSNLEIFRGPPLSTVWPIIVGNSPQIIQEGIG